MQHANIYDYLEPGKYFDTIWARLPAELTNFIQPYLNPIRGMCEWCFPDDHLSKLHVTLRYLGYDNKELRDQILEDKVKFIHTIKKTPPVKIILGSIKIWQSPPSDPKTTARLNWELLDYSVLKMLHQSLLEIEGYSFFRSLEGPNFDPHINLAKIDLNNDNNLPAVTKYLENLRLKTVVTTIDQIEINLASPEKSQKIQVPLLI